MKSGKIPYTGSQTLIKTNLKTRMNTLLKVKNHIQHLGFSSPAVLCQPKNPNNTPQKYLAVQCEKTKEK